MGDTKCMCGRIIPDQNHNYTGKSVKVKDRVIFRFGVSGHIGFGTIVGFTPKQVKIKKLSDGYIVTIQPSCIIVITEEISKFLLGK